MKYEIIFRFWFWTRLQQQLTWRRMIWSRRPSGRSSPTAASWPSPTGSTPSWTTTGSWCSTRESSRSMTLLMNCWRYWKFWILIASNIYICLEFWVNFLWNGKRCWTTTTRRGQHKHVNNCLFPTLRFLLFHDFIPKILLFVHDLFYTENYTE